MINGFPSVTAGNSRPYKCIFFDLDHTLWDYECNARETLQELHAAHSLQERGVAFEEFHRHFKEINFRLWQLYDRGQISNEVIRHHRLIELYLAETLGIGVDDVHDEADKLEHVLSEELEARIDRALGFPTHDPHGDPIPDANLEWPKERGA